MKIIPESYLDPEALAHLSSFPLRAKKIIDGLNSGTHNSPSKGSSVEFIEHKMYTPGDDLRRLDWKIFAKNEKLVTKVFKQESNLDILFIIDISQSMKYGSNTIKKQWGGTLPSIEQRKWTKYDHATSIIAALSWLFLSIGDRVGLMRMSENIKGQIEVAGGQEHWNNIILELSKKPLDEDKKFINWHNDILNLRSKKNIIIIVSDFLDSINKIKKTLESINNNGHDIIPIQVLDYAEKTFPFNQQTLFIGLEDKKKIFIDPKSIKKEYLNEFKKHQILLETITIELGLDLIKSNTNENLATSLTPVLARRLKGK